MEISNLPPHHFAALKFARSQRIISDYNAITPFQLASLVAPIPSPDKDPWDERIAEEIRNLVEGEGGLEVGRESMRFMARVAGGLETGKVYEDMVVDGVAKAELTRRKDYKVEVPLILREKLREVDEEWVGWRREVPRLWSGIWASLGYVGGGVGLEGEVVKKIDLCERLEIGGDEIRWLQDVVKEGVKFGRVKTHPEFWKQVPPRYEGTPPLLEPIPPPTIYKCPIKIEKPEPLENTINNIKQELETSLFKSEALSSISDPIEPLKSSFSRPSSPQYTLTAALRVTSPITPPPSSPTPRKATLDQHGHLQPDLAADMPSEVSLPDYPKRESQLSISEDEESSPFFNRQIAQNVHRFTSALEQETLVLADCTLRLPVPVVTTPVVLAPWEAPEKHAGKWRGMLGLAKKKYHVDKSRLKWRPFGKDVVEFANGGSVKGDFLERVDLEEEGVKRLFVTEGDTKRAERDICEAIQTALKFDDEEDDIELLPLVEMRISKPQQQNTSETTDQQNIQTKLRIPETVPLNPGNESQESSKIPSEREYQSDRADRLAINISSGPSIQFETNEQPENDYSSRSHQRGTGPTSSEYANSSSRKSLQETRESSSSSLGKRKVLPQDTLSRLISAHSKRPRPASSALSFNTADSLTTFLSLRGTNIAPRPPRPSSPVKRPPSPDITLISSSPSPPPVPTLPQTYTIVIPTTHLHPTHYLRLPSTLRLLDPPPNLIPRDFPHPRLTPDLILSPDTSLVITTSLNLTQSYLLPGEEPPTPPGGYKVETNLVKAKIMHLLTFGFATVYLIVIGSAGDSVVVGLKGWAEERGVVRRVVVRVVGKQQEVVAAVGEGLVRFGGAGWVREGLSAEEEERERMLVEGGWNPFYEG